jgi:hypothetical protein
MFGGCKIGKGQALRGCDRILKSRIAEVDGIKQEAALSRSEPRHYAPALPFKVSPA